MIQKGNGGQALVRCKWFLQAGREEGELYAFRGPGRLISLGVLTEGGILPHFYYARLDSRGKVSLCHAVVVVSVVTPESATREINFVLLNVDDCTFAVDEEEPRTSGATESPGSERHEAYCHLNLDGNNITAFKLDHCFGL